MGEGHLVLQRWVRSECYLESEPLKMNIVRKCPTTVPHKSVMVFKLKRFFYLSC